MKEPVICFDVDGVLANIHKTWLSIYNKDYNDDLTVDKITAWEMADFVKPECGKKIYEYLRPELYENVLPIPGGLDVVKIARKLGRVIFVTSVYHEAGAKFEWLKRWHFFDGINKPSNDYAEVGDKGLIRADILIDDYERNLFNFKGTGLLFDAPWNRTAEGLDGIKICRVYGHEGVTAEIKRVSLRIYYKYREMRSL